MVTMAAADDNADGVQKIFQENETTLHMLSLYYHQAACTLLAKNDNQIIGPVKPLTRRETQILQWAFASKSNWDIANILNISESAVNFHIKNIRQKLGVHSKLEAVSKAIMLKLIDLS